MVITVVLEEQTVLLLITVKKLAALAVVQVPMDLLAITDLALAVEVKRLLVQQVALER
jgi:hypothetical protein